MSSPDNPRDPELERGVQWLLASSCHAFGVAPAGGDDGDGFFPLADFTSDGMCRHAADGATCVHLDPAVWAGGGVARLCPTHAAAVRQAGGVLRSHTPSPTESPCWLAIASLSDP